jgi:hypothetical protein
MCDQTFEILDLMKIYMQCIGKQSKENTKKYVVHPSMNFHDLIYMGCRAQVLRKRMRL